MKKENVSALSGQVRFRPQPGTIKVYNPLVKYV